MQIEVTLVWSGGDEESFRTEVSAVPRVGDMARVRDRNFKVQLVQWFLPAVVDGPVATVWLEARP